MAYHVQLRHSFHVASAFNLDEQELQRTVLEPWRGGRTVELGGKRFKPAESSLSVLEGRRLDPSELSLGQGWGNAGREARNVTRELLAAAPAAPSPGAAGAAAQGVSATGAVAVLGESPAAAAAAHELLGELALTASPWASLRAAILTRPANAQALPSAVVIAFGAHPADGADAGWWLDVGLALGALGRRAVVVLPDGRAVPAAVRDAGAVALGPGAAAALGARLGAAGG